MLRSLNHKRQSEKRWLLPLNCLLSLCVIGFCFVELFFDGRMSFSQPALSAPSHPFLPADSLNSPPLFFIANRGQLESPVHYYLEGARESIYFTPHGLTFSINTDKTYGIRNAGWVLQLDYVDANKQPRIHGEDQQRAVFSYFGKGRGAKQNGIPTFKRVVYEDIWQGIDAIYEGDGNRLKTIFRVKPGADPRRIKLVWRGASDVRITAAGEMIATTPLRDMVDERPVSYQHIGDQRVEIATAYLPERNGNGRDTSDKPFVYGFQVDSYDQSKTLEIDPAITISSTLLGGKKHDYGEDIAVDSANNIYITGTSHSSDGFPARVGPAPVNFGGDGDVFVAKLSLKGELLYCGFIGGPGKDGGTAIKVDQLGAIYIAGYTQSAEFPVTYNAFDTTFSQSMEGFIAKLDPAGLNLLYCTYLGGSQTDEVGDLAIDNAGNAYVTGTTDSQDFPTKGLPSVYKGNRDVFVAKLDGSGSRLLYSLLLGGGSVDQGKGIAIDRSGNAYITGTTESADYPGVGIQSSFKGDGDAFVTKISPSAESIIFSRFLGGQHLDAGVAVAVDDVGRAYIAGTTFSSDFPAISSGPLAVHHGEGDAFVTRLDEVGNLALSIHVGGSLNDIAADLAIDRSGNAYITGQTHSHDFPTVGSAQSVYAGGIGDAFVAKIDSKGTTLVFSTYLGGRGDDLGEGIALTDNATLCVIGSTRSSDFPADYAYSSFFPSFPDNVDVFITRIDLVPDNYLPPASGL